ncbi:tetratricopeptide repeat protein [Micromonospora olivasterospora]|uniref:Tetratricopeptide repeat protein n=1 Tax=Micromonospora olivasterospora TaxID=1880 RepID=A0A562IHA3_MICOL|nr:tetratricopeptide repeat protein [Micromonospora olivasterospora]TWH70186.1 tetratricopeptide repeat protein [Micromonospora olivasterospora]
MGFRWRRPAPLPADLERRSRAALALFDAGQYAPAERAWQRLLVDCERELGPEHPETVVTLDRLGSALFRLRRLVESADRHREARRRAVSTFGRDHPATLTFAHNLGCALVVAHQWAEGLPVLRDTLRRKRRRLGAAHPETLDTAKTLGASLFMAGNAPEAVEILEPAHRAAVRRFGPDDPLTREIGDNLAIVLRNSHPGHRPRREEPGP